jgi:predicted transcriptional regulator
MIMDAIDYRNAQWADIQGKLEGYRAKVYNNLFLHGAATTRELAARIPMDILTVRPRVTELCQLGFARIVPGHEHEREGTYEAVPIHAAKAEFERQKKRATEGYQPELKLL